MSRNQQIKAVLLIGVRVHRGRVKVERLSESVFDHDAVAMEKTELCIMRRDDLQAFLMKYPAISIKILEEFSRRLEQTEKQLSSLTSEDTEQQIAAYLIELMDKGQSKTLTLPMPKKDLASYLGTTPETVSRKLADFQEQGIIEQVGQ